MGGGEVAGDGSVMNVKERLSGNIWLYPTRAEESGKVFLRNGI